MFTVNQYHRASSLEEAFLLNQKKNNRLIGGMQWMKMSEASFGTAIDLSDLGLDKIEETEDGWRIGAMVTLREIEENKYLNQYTNGAVKEALRHIVGVQFRNMATIGGTIAGKYGFSDPITLLSVMDCDILLYCGNEETKVFPIAEYLGRPLGNDIVTGIFIHKCHRTFYYESVRPTETDLPTLTCAIAKDENTWKAAIGARPQLATVYEEKISDFVSAKIFAEHAAEQIKVDSNLRGSAQYRQHLMKILIARGVATLETPSVN